MSISAAYHALAAVLADRVAVPPIEQVYLPPRIAHPEFRDEFGFVLLADGSAGAFYTSLPGELDALWRHCPSGPLRAEPMQLMDGFLADDLPARALALGAFNAISQHVFRRSGLDLWRTGGDGVDRGAGRPAAGDWVGMVGYFCPLIDRLNADGINVLVLERLPERVEVRPGVRLTRDPHALADCEHVLCTAATLVNDSLDELLAITRDARSFSIIGPSGSGLPDVLFDHGVDAVGGTLFASAGQLLDRLRTQDSWRDAGRKYQLARASYPGLAHLLGRIEA